MAVRVNLSDGTQVFVEATLAEWEQGLHRATVFGSVLEIEDPDDGHIFVITPQAVQHFQEGAEGEDSVASPERAGQDLERTHSGD